MNNKIENKQFEDEIDAAKINEQMILKNEINDQSDEHTLSKVHNISLIETDIHLIGDRSIIAQFVQILSYIRHAVRNNMDGQLVLKFGTEIANPDLNFDVNGYAVPDLVPPSDFRIN